MLTVMKRIQWWGVVENGVLRFAAAQKEETAQAGNSVPITIQYPIEEVTTPERMIEVFESMKVPDAQYRELMEDIEAEDLRFEQELHAWMTGNEYGQMVQATLGARLFDEFVEEIKQWMYEHLA